MIDHYKNRKVDDYFETNRLIHELITEGSGNQTLVDTINNLSAKVRRARFSAHMTDESWAKAVAEHEEMIDALESRDPGSSGGGLNSTHRNQAHYNHRGAQNAG